VRRSSILAGLLALGCAERPAPNRAARAVSAVTPVASAVSAGTPVASAVPRLPPSSAAARAFYGSHFSKRPRAADLVELGRLLFFDPALSASGKQACSSCHDPKFAYGPPGVRSVELGGPALDQPGIRAVPSLRYLEKVPRFGERFFDEDLGDADQGPTGGRTWDGRADTLHDQALAPLLSPFEMANASVGEVVAKVARASYAERFRDTFGRDVFDDPERASNAVLLVLEVFQQSPADFYPFTSRYDAYLRQRGALDARELRGLALFDDAKKGNCAHCHTSHVRRGKFPLFTDFGFIALGVPRNREIPKNRDPAFFDLGLCGPLRSDLARHREYCGEFRTPPLRNVSLRRSFFHNGVVHSLEAVLSFYATRDTTPAKWYPGSHGALPYDDLPPSLRANVNQEPPFGRKPGQAPALTPSEREDLLAFLKTLDDADVASPDTRAAGAK
jgi:cytochrome c peroxidase